MVDTRHDEAPGSEDPRVRLASGLFFGAWAGAGWYALVTNAQILGVDFGLDPGPGLLPRIVLTILSSGALILVVSGVAGLLKSAAAPLPWGTMLRGSILPILLCLSLATYLPLVRGLGFIAATSFYSLALMVVLSRRSLRVFPKATAVSIAIGTAICVALIYALFVRWIGVPLR